MIFPLIVDVALAPRSMAPRNSQTTAIRTACLRVTDLAETLVANATLFVVQNNIHMRHSSLIVRIRCIIRAVPIWRTHGYLSITLKVAVSHHSQHRLHQSQMPWGNQRYRLQLSSKNIVDIRSWLWHPVECEPNWWRRRRSRRSSCHDGGSTTIILQWQRSRTRLYCIDGLSIEVCVILFFVIPVWMYFLSSEGWYLYRIVGFWNYASLWFGFQMGFCLVFGVEISS